MGSTDDSFPRDTTGGEGFLKSNLPETRVPTPKGLRDTPITTRLPAAGGCGLSIPGAHPSAQGAYETWADAGHRHHLDPQTPEADSEEATQGERHAAHGCVS